MKVTNEYVNVSHSIGVPFGAIGTGYGVFGKYGFIYPNFDGIPHEGRYKDMGDIHNYDYIEPHDEDAETFMAVTISDGDKTVAFQESEIAWTDAVSADKVDSFAFLPFSIHKMASAELGINATMKMFSPFKPHSLDSSSIPVVCMKLVVENTADTARDFSIALKMNEAKPLKSDNGDVASFVDNATLHIEAGESAAANVYFAWHFKHFNTPSPFLADDFDRYYTRNFKSADEVIDAAKKNADSWEADIANWQASYDVPVQFKKVWFSSLSSIIASTLLSADPLFFEVESPHPWVNTMDVSIYSSWIYLINWPEIEEMDMRLFNEHIPKDGDDKGFVWHSLWTDKTHYVEEPTFILRAYRDYLWFGDDKFIKDLYPTMKDSFEKVYKEVFDGLIETKHGNQSYDVWKMPGVNSYVNVVWIYAIYAMRELQKKFDDGTTLAGREVKDILDEAICGFDKYLWNGKYYNCFFRTPGAREVNEPTSVFTDAMFGRWVISIQKDLPEILSEDKIEKTVKYAYNNNLVDDKPKGFRGWANGMLDGSVPLSGEQWQYHVKTCWLGAQLDLGSLLAEYGDEDSCMDVFTSIESSFHNNHLAIGEWNKSVFLDGTSGFLPEEVCKDTPRFPPYPRYKSSWEYVTRMLGLKVDKDSASFAPFKSFDFAMKDIALAGNRYSITVKKNWTKVIVNGAEASEAIVPRDGGSYTISFE